jgi:hypothetical protein
VVDHDPGAESILEPVFEAIEASEPEAGLEANLEPIEVSPHHAMVHHPSMEAGWPLMGNSAGMLSLRARAVSAVLQKVVTSRSLR